jgi:hypothetical protein
MSKFKVGDRVRALVSDIDVTKGAEYVIQEVENDDVWFTDDAGDSWWMSFDQVELVQPALRAGDRIKPKAEHANWINGHWAKYWGRREGEPVNGAYYALSASEESSGAMISATPNGSGPYWPAEYFDVVGHVSDERPTIVARIDGGPSPRPYVHANRDAATKEAERLAKANPGGTFGIYELVAKSTASAPVVSTEVL